MRRFGQATRRVAAASSIVLAIGLGAGGYSAAVAASSTRAGLLPPNNPPANVPEDVNLQNFCDYGTDTGGTYTANPKTDDSAKCIDAALHNLDYARVLEGLGPMILPTNFSSMTQAEQILVAVNLERVARGAVPFEGLNASLDSAAHTAAVADQDPSIPAGFPFSTAGGNWAGADPNVLSASYEWGYDDGLGATAVSSNGDCSLGSAPSESGCWGHRDNILRDYSGGGYPIVLGAAEVNGSFNYGYGGTPSYTELFSNYTAGQPALAVAWSSIVIPKAPPAPQVLSASESSCGANYDPVGSTGGGEQVTIAGNYFTGATEVLFGAVSAKFTDSWDGSITATAPAHAGGTVPVRVVTPEGESAAVTYSDYTFQAGPTVCSVTPASGRVGGRTKVTVVGSGFGAGAKVMIDTKDATGVDVLAPTSLTAVTPVGTGTWCLQVSTSAGTSSGNCGYNAAFTYAEAPTVTSVADSPTGSGPGSGPGDGATLAYIQGTNFFAGAIVKFGSVVATGVDVYDSSQLTAVVPQGTGTVAVTVTTPSGTSAPVAAGDFTYTGGVPAPVIYGISPASGAAGTAVTISGANLAPGCTVRFGSTLAEVEYGSATGLVAVAPAGTGTVNVSVTTAGGRSTTVTSDRFTYN